jgi:hypothetical protein
VTRERLAVALLVGWAAATTLVLGSLMAGHGVALPGLRATTAWADTFGDHAQVWVVPLGCSCTRGVIDHLAARTVGPLDHVVFAGAAPVDAARLAAVGYRVHAQEPKALQDNLGVEAGPLLVVLRGGAVRWSGGLFDTPATVNPRSDRVLASVDRAPEPPLPVFGCPVSPALASRLDPLGLR